MCLSYVQGTFCNLFQPLCQCVFNTCTVALRKVRVLVTYMQRQAQNAVGVYVMLLCMSSHFEHINRFVDNENVYVNMLQRCYIS